MAEDDRTYIRVHDGMPDHPKVDALSDKAFRLLVTTWCWCSEYRTDGKVKRALWDRRGTPKARRELIDAGLAEDLGPDGVQMHDYLQHQRSKAEIDEYSAARKASLQRSSVAGNHKRWHVQEGRWRADCPLCQDEARPDRDPDWESGGTPAGSLIGRGIGRGIEDGHLGGVGPDTNARGNAPAPIFDPDNPRCARHAHIGPGEPVPSCRACAEVRRQARPVDDQVARQAALRTFRAAVDACDECDEVGMVLRADGKVDRCPRGHRTAS
jgi:hypothetical protein